MSAKRKKIRDEDLQGFKYFKKITRLLERLHDTACARDRAGNRRLFMDQYLALLLLYMFNPICESLRGLQQASQLKKVQRVLGVGRASLACLLIALWTGRRPTLRTYEMLCYYFTGWADLEEVEAHLAGLKEQTTEA